MSKIDNKKKTALEKFFRKKEKKHPPTSVEINQVVKAQKDSATIWKECSSRGTTFQYRRNENIKDKHVKYHGIHTHDIRKKVRHRVRLCYCCRQTGHQAKNCLRNTSTKTSKRKLTGIEYSN